MPAFSINEQWIFSFLNALSSMGVVVFAASGALTAADKKMDIIGFILIGTVTAIGGGTLRDLLLGVSPVSWVRHPLNVYLCVMACVITYFSVRHIRNRAAWILWMDAVGLSAFAVLGTQTAMALNTPWAICIVMGVMSATFGGIIRDVLCAEVLTLMRPELYITCALFAASAMVLLRAFGLSAEIAALIAFIAGLGLRAAAIIYNLKFPQFGRYEN